MSVIIRLQNLPWSANALDIRQYFHGLSIPEGGVHIVGGELGDAFIAFSTDEDARQAMLIDGGKIKEVKIKLFLSSRSEMQKVIETARAQSLNLQSFMQITVAPIPNATQITPTQIPVTPSQTTPAIPPLPQVSQMPIKTATPEIKPPPLPPTIPGVSITPEAVKVDSEPEKKDQDNESISSKDAKRSRRGGRSRSKSKNRSKSRDRSKSRSKSRDRSSSRDRSYRRKDRYRDRRRRDKSRSRDRRDRRRYRDRSRSRDRSRKSSKDRKRDSDRIDCNSSENSNGAKNVEATNKSTEIPLPTVAKPTPVPTSKPGFSNSGWVSSGSAEKSDDSAVITNPIGFSIGKPTLAAPNQTAVPRVSSPTVPQQITLPQQIQLPQQTPTSQQNQVSHPMVIPQPPAFPPLPMMNPNDLDRGFCPPSYPVMSSRPFNNVQTNPLFGHNQTQLSQSESNKILPQNQTVPLHPPVSWPPMNHGLPFMPPQQVQSGANSMEKSLNPNQPNMPNMGMGMYARPLGMTSNEKFQPPYLQQDPRMQGIFNNKTARNDYLSPMPQINNASPKKSLNYDNRDFGSTNSKDTTLNACIEIRNMSMNTTIVDIRRFFQGLHIPNDGVKIITDKKGNKVGMAYVRFLNTYFKEMALKTSGQSLNGSIVEVLHIDDNIFDKAADFSEFSGNYLNTVQQSYHDTFNDRYIEPLEPFVHLVIHNVPPYSKDRDIANLYKGFKVDDAFVLARTGRKTATGYVKFRTPIEARKALTMSSRLTIGYTPIKATVCYEHEFADARDLKNMEENDEEMMDTKDEGYCPQEPRGPRGAIKHPLYNYNEERSEPRYNEVEKRVGGKGLLPTPSGRPFDPRPSTNVTNSNHNFHSRFDMRQDVPPRLQREEFSNNKPFNREDYNQKPYIRENRFQSRLSRDEPSKRLLSEELYKKSQQNDAEEKLNQSQPEQSLNTTEQATFSKKQTPMNDTVPMMTVNNKKEILLENKDVVQMEDSKSVTEDKNISKPVVQHELSSDIPPKDKATPTDEIAPQGEKFSEIASDQDKLKEPNNYIASHHELKKNLGGPIKTDCIFLRGLPFTATDRDILDFFSDVGLAPTQIHIMLDKQDKPSGDAFCEFSSIDEAIRALTKNQTLMGRSVVYVEPVPREEMSEALGVIVPHPDNPLLDPPRGYPYPNYHRPDHRYPRSQQSGGYQPHFPPRGRGRGAFRGRHYPPTELELESQNVNAFGKPGCVVALENVPYRAEVQDILDFFRGFFVSRDNVIRRFDESGKPTGDARVCLSSPVEAHRAIRTLNFTNMFNRQIHLSLVQ